MNNHSSLFTHVFTAAFTSLICCSCSDNPSDNGGRQFSSLSSVVAQYDGYGRLVGPAAGVTVTLKGHAAFEAVTDGSGRWRLTDIPADRYAISCTADGYSTTRLNYGLVGNGESSLDTIRLAAYPTYTISSVELVKQSVFQLLRDTIVTDPATGSPLLERDTMHLDLKGERQVLVGRLSEPSPFGTYSRIRVYVGTKNPVTPSNALMYEDHRCSERDEFFVLAGPLLKQAGIDSGSSGYVTMYPLAPWGNAVFDPETGAYIDSRVGSSASQTLSVMRVWP